MEPLVYELVLASVTPNPPVRTGTIMEQENEESNTGEGGGPEEDFTQGEV